nr:hypothetical protein [Actinoallomurus iriomotensis]
MIARVLARVFGFALGHDQVRVVQQPIDRGGGQGLGHDGVEPAGVGVGGYRQCAAFVGGIDDAVERLGLDRFAGKHADVVDHDQVRSADAGDGAGHALVDLGLGQQGAEGFQAVPADPHAGVDGVAAQRFDQMALAGPAGSSDHQVLAAAGPFQGDQGLLNLGGDRGPLALPGREALVVGESGRSDAGSPFDVGAAHLFLGQHPAQELGVVPALLAGGDQQLAGRLARVFHLQGQHRRLQLGGQFQRLGGDPLLGNKQILSSRDRFDLFRRFRWWRSWSSSCWS